MSDTKPSPTQKITSILDKLTLAQKIEVINELKENLKKEIEQETKKLDETKAYYETIMGQQ